MKRHVGSNFDEFLSDEDLLSEAEATAVKRVTDDKLSKSAMAKGMQTSVDNGLASGEPPAGTAEDRVFDLTARVGWTNRFVWGLLALVFTANGLVNLARWNNTDSGGTQLLVLGLVYLSLGVLVLPGSLLFRRMNKLVLGFSQEELVIQRGLFVRQRVPWDSLAGITLSLMTAEFVSREGPSRVIQFGMLGYADNQEIKPQVFQTIRDFAQAKGIPVIEDGAA